MAKYRKKPVEIEAFQYDGDLKGKDGKWYVPEWAVKAFEDDVIYYGSIDCDSPPVELFIKKLEGNHHVSVGDYIIQGVNGELYPCKPDIFEKTYDKEKNRMNELPKIRIENKGAYTHVFVNEKEIDGLREVRFRTTAGGLPVMGMEFAACNVEINGQFLPQLPDALKGYYRAMDGYEENSLEETEELLARVTEKVQRLRGKETF